MAVQVTFTGVFASRTGEKQCRMQVEAGATLRRLLEQFEARYGEKFGRCVFRTSTPPRPLQTHTRIVVNNGLTANSELDQALAAGR